MYFFNLKIGRAGGQFRSFIGISFFSFALLFVLAFKLINEYSNRKKDGKKVPETKVWKF
jgi:hypothetical protein